jgi:trk system potassium uptake protein
MKFVIVGYGRVGARTARVLREEGHDVVAIDNDPDKVRRAEEEGYDAIEGGGADESVLEAAGLEEADALAGLTGDLNVNFAACLVGKHHGCRTVMRIDDDYQEAIYRKYADDVDEIIYPERLGAAGAKTALLGGNFNVVAELTELLQLATITVEESAPAAGSRLTELDLPQNARVYAHGSGTDPLTIPLPQTRADPGDRVAVLGDSKGLDAVRGLLLDEPNR